MDGPTIKPGGIKSILDSMISGAAKNATGSSDLTKKTIKTLTDMAKQSGDMARQFSIIHKNITSGNVTESIRGVVTFTRQFGTTLLTGAKAITKAFDEAASLVFRGSAEVSKLISLSASGVAGTMMAGATVITDSMRELAKKLDSKGLADGANAIESAMKNYSQAVMFFYQDALSQRNVMRSSLAQTGYTQKGITASNVTATMGKGVSFKTDTIAGQMRSLYSKLGRGGAETWGTALIEQGVTKGKELLADFVTMGKAMNIEAGPMGEILNDYLTISDNATTAVNKMEMGFRAAQAAAKGTNIPVKTLAKDIQEATVGARFMNVDMKVVASTMQMLTKQSAKLKAMGIDMRKDGGDILKDLTMQTTKTTDALHAYFGTKGGMEGSPIEGLIRSKFGTNFANSLQSTAGGGFNVKEGTNTDSKMMVQRLDVMKRAMIEAGKSGRNDSERLYLQMKVATDTFGMSEKTARVLAMSSKDSIANIAKNPELANSMKSQRQLLASLATTATLDQNMKRAAHRTALLHLQVAIDSASKLAIIAAKALNIKIDPAIERQINNNLATGGQQMALNMKNQLKAVGAMRDPGVGEAMTRFSNLFTYLMNKEVAEYTGGYVQSAYTGRNIYSVAERGAELYSNGNGAQALFSMPNLGTFANPGTIHSNEDTMRIFNAGLHGVTQSAAAMAQPEPVGNTSITLNISAGSSISEMMSAIENALVENMS